MAGEIIKSLVERNRKDLMVRLPKYLGPESFFQLCYALDRNPKLAQVAQRNPDSVISAIMKAADCGLVIGNAYEHCWIIPYADEAVFTIGWKGFVFQWIHAGAILGIDAQCVYLGDHLEVTGGDEPKIVHRIQLDDPKRDDYRWLNDSKNIVGAYAIATLPTGLKARRWCPKGEIEFAMSRSPGARKDDSPWKHNYPAMARKTPIRRLNGVIQVCGPTPENKEAWDRYSRTLELDRTDFRILEDDLGGGLEDDDLPGNKKNFKPSSPLPEEEKPPSGARTESTHPGAAAKRGSATPSDPPPPPSAAVDDQLVSLDDQDDLVKLSVMAGLKTTGLIALMKERFGVTDLTKLLSSQARQLTIELQQRFGGSPQQSQ